LTTENIDNCLVTVEYADNNKECYKCESGYTYDNEFKCIKLQEAEEKGICTSLTGEPVGTDECSYCDQGAKKCEEGKALAPDGTCVAAVT